VKQKKLSGTESSVNNEEQLMLTESEDNKNSSGDGDEDGCSMTSSITNNMNANEENNLDEYDEEFFYDDLSAAEKCENGEDLPVETAYCPSVKEEFGEVKEIIFVNLKQ
jgi:hypothetical protein